jgi:hypothetical protein
VILSRLIGTGLVGMALGSAPVAAQVTPGAAVPPPDDTPSVRVGGTLFIDYTKTLEPEVTDANGNRVSQDAFNVARAYINVTGQLNHVIAFRITPDITRESSTGPSLAGSMVYRLKYGFVQINLDDWIKWRGSYARVGMIQTPYVEFEESIYRYRFQGPVMVDREGYMPSADFGASFRTQFPRGYGEFVGGLYNGEGYTRADPNDQKALQLRGTLRPLPDPGTLRGLRVTLFYDEDHYVEDADRRRFVSMATFEHRFVNVGWVYLDATDQTNLTQPKVDSSGHSIWIIPRWAHGELRPTPTTGQVRASLEGLFRYDRLEPDQANQSVKERWIGGVAYWPRMTTGSVSSAFLLDYEQVNYSDFAPARPTEKRFAVHMLVSF